MIIVVSKRFTEPYSKRWRFHRLWVTPRGVTLFGCQTAAGDPPLPEHVGTPAEQRLKYYWNLIFCIDFRVSRKYSSHTASNPHSAVYHSARILIFWYEVIKGAGFRVVCTDSCTSLPGLLAGEKVLAPWIPMARASSTSGGWVETIMRANASPYVMMGLSKMESTASSLLDLTVYYNHDTSNIFQYSSLYFRIFHHISRWYKWLFELVACPIFIHFHQGLCWAAWWVRRPRNLIAMQLGEGSPR